ncbi:MAG: RnfABCDGE type electron transport complex subunit B [Clostridiales bacterium]|nr:RnfABCDGE type electron transport complex subunit B [Clostridiales bacterium]
MLNNLLFAEIGRQIQWMSFAIAIAIVVGVSLVLGVLILLISKFCQVKEDPRIKEIEGCLAGANCGACGYPGCAGFAKALVDGTAKLDACGQTPTEARIEISNILGVAVEGNTEPTVAVVACCGGSKCQDKYAYQGYGDCISQNLLAGGRKACEVGCMGSGSCVDACPYNSIECREGYAHIDPDLCRSCGICIQTCPKRLIKRVPASAKVYVACSTQCRGKDVMTKCQAGCIACGKCERNCPTGAIVLVNNVPIIDYGKCINCGKCLEGCPRQCIKYLHPEAVKGSSETAEQAK